LNRSSFYLATLQCKTTERYIGCTQNSNSQPGEIWLLTDCGKRGLAGHPAVLSDTATANAPGHAGTDDVAFTELFTVQEAVAK